LILINKFSSYVDTRTKNTNLDEIMTKNVSALLCYTDNCPK